MGSGSSRRQTIFRGSISRLQVLVLILAVALVAATTGPAELAIGVEAPPDPTAAGPLSHRLIEYDAGPTVIASQSPTNPGVSPQRLHGALFVPEGSGPVPVVVLVHGRHNSCHVPLVAEETFDVPDWKGPFPGEIALHPCPSTPVSEDIPSYRGYDYMGAQLASHGYLVVSTDVNGINSYDSASALIEDGQFQRAELIARTLDLLHDWNTADGPDGIGSNLVGRVDLSRIGVMGHSRGGEGATAFIDHNRTRLGRRYPGVKAVFALAPTNFFNWRPHGVNYATLLPLCDGDVFDLQGASAYDDGRFVDSTDRFARAQFTVRGANHNFFNTVWSEGTFPDDHGPPAAYGGSAPFDTACTHREYGNPTSVRLTAPEQRAIGLALVGGFLRRYVGDETQFGRLVKGAEPLPASACPSNGLHCGRVVGTSYLGPSDERELILRPAGGTAGEAPAVTEAGSPLTGAGFDTFAACTPGVQRGDVLDGSVTSRDEIVGPFTEEPCPTKPTRGRARQITLAWSGAATLTVHLPAAGFNAGELNALTFRTGVNFDGDDSTVEEPQDFEVELRDINGTTASVSAAAFTSALLPPEGTARRALTLNGVSIPLTAFSGVDPAHLTKIQLQFGTTTRSGSIQLAELGFQKLSPVSRTIPALPRSTREGELPATGGVPGQPGPTILGMALGLSLLCRRLLAV